MVAVHYTEVFKINSIFLANFFSLLWNISKNIKIVQ